MLTLVRAYEKPKELLRRFASPRMPNRHKTFGARQGLHLPDLPALPALRSPTRVVRYAVRTKPPQIAPLRELGKLREVGRTLFLEGIAPFLRFVGCVVQKRRVARQLLKTRQPIG